MTKLVLGENDLATLNPDVAAEADGWDSSSVVYGSHSNLNWKCEKGHTWKAQILVRTHAEIGCPECAEYGFNPGKPAWLYLMERKGEQQFGITNVLSKRMQFHKRFNWNKLDVTGPHDGQAVLNIENKLKKWLKKEIGLMPNKIENRDISNLEVHSLTEIKEKSGIEMTIF